jgi:hypothetical protein
MEYTVDINTLTLQHEFLNDSSWHDSGAVFKGNLNYANHLQLDLK